MNAIIPGAVIAFTIADIVAASTPAPCLAGKRDALVRGHFEGPLICSRRDASFHLAGRTAVTGYSIYTYRYRFLPAGGGTMHGGQRLIVFHGSDYVGQYRLSPPPFLTATVQGTQVLLHTPGIRETVRLDFSHTPPGRIFANGEIEDFVR
jgi:hypothetical protein